MSQPQAVQDILHLRDLHCPPASLPGSTRSACHQCIYIIFHLHNNSVYIGHTIQYLHERLHQHVNDATKNLWERKKNILCTAPLPLQVLIFDFFP
jgi:hypothetical protein